MADVTPIPRQHKVGFAPDPGVIKELEAALALAREGKIRAVGLAVVYHDDLIPDGSTGDGWALTPNTQFALAYAIQSLQLRFAQHCHNDRQS